MRGTSVIKELSKTVEAQQINLLQVIMHFHLSTRSKEHQHTGKFLFDVLMFKQQGTTTYFLILSLYDLG